MMDYLLLSRLDLNVMKQLRRDIRNAVLAQKPMIVLDTEEIRTICAALYHNDAAVTPVNKLGDFDALLDGTQLEAWTASNIFWDLPTENAGPADDDKDGDDRKNKAEKSKVTIQVENPQTFVLRIPSDAANNKQSQELLANLRRLTDRIARTPRLCQTVFVLYGSASELPADLARKAEMIDIAYPAADDLRCLTRAMLTDRGIPAPQERVDILARELRGFTCEEAIGMLIRILNADPDEDGRAAIDSPKRCQTMIQQKKSEVLKSGELLELIPPRTAELGNMHSVRRWIDARKRFIRDQHGDSLNIGPAIPMGMMLTGVPGCGKSETAAYLADKWELPLIRMDYGRLMGGLVGESERKLRRALNQAAVMECILWIDEMEKSVGNANQGGGDGGTAQRMQATLLTWMQERKSRNIRCFIFATANSLRGIAKEMMRYGRIDELFSVMLPTHSGCRGILRVLMRKAEREARHARRDAGDPNWEKFVLFTDDCYGNILNTFISGDEKQTSRACLAHPDGNVKEAASLFVSGTDLQKIFDLARMHHAMQENATYPITDQLWLNALQNALTENDLSVTGTGAGSMDEIAMDYILMLRGKFILADNDRDVKKEHPNDLQSIFHQSDYTVSDKDRKVSLHKSTEPKWAYDQLLYQDLSERILRLGEQYEKNADARLTSGL